MQRSKLTSRVTLPLARQWAIVGIIAAAAGLLFFAIPAVTHLAEHDVPPTGPDVTSPDMFKATDVQWATLKLGKAQELAFYSSEQTDGKIAADDDTTTQVFSQYSGRVVKVYAKAGTPW